MKTFLYPTPRQVRLVCDWNAKGFTVVDPLDGARSPKGDRNRARTENLSFLWELLRRLDTGPEWLQRMHRVHHRGQGWRQDAPLLAAHLGRVLRLHGYVFRSAGRHHPVPLTGMQLRVLRETVAGEDTWRIADGLGVSPRQIAEALRCVTHTLSTETGRSVPPHCAAAVAVDRGWLPTAMERSVLVAQGAAGLPYLEMKP